MTELLLKLQNGELLGEYIIGYNSAGWSEIARKNQRSHVEKICRAQSWTWH